MRSLKSEIVNIFELDELNRLVIPKEIVRVLNAEEHKLIYFDVISKDTDNIILKPILENELGSYDAIGIKRKLDNLNRIVIPKKYTTVNLELDNTKSIKGCEIIFTYENVILLKPIYTYD